MHKVLFTIGFACQIFYFGSRYGVKLEKDITEVIYGIGVILALASFVLYRKKVIMMQQRTYDFLVKMRKGSMVKE